MDRSELNSPVLSFLFSLWSFPLSLGTRHRDVFLVSVKKHEYPTVLRLFTQTLQPAVKSE
jgi:hypothetical protein